MKTPILQLYHFLFFLAFLCLPFSSFANEVHGKVTDRKGNVIPFATILIKGTAKGTTSNSKGLYSLNLNEGSYILICQQIGYKSVEKGIKLKTNVLELDFEMEEQQYELKEVVVSNKAEDPAYEIIRKTIKAKELNAKLLDNFKCQVYLKGQIALKDYPKKFMGDTVDFNDGDTSKQKILYLSETIADYSIKDKLRKVEVVSTKVSGFSDGFGLGSPNVISFYQNTISLSNAFNPRGFISPIADNALNYYRFKYMGSFYENGLEITKIKVIPRRKQEPLFTGYINIIEGKWIIHGLQLQLLKEQQLQLIDTLTLTQTYMPIDNSWMMKQQVIDLNGKFLGFEFGGNILQVYNQYETEKIFEKKYFTNTIIKYLDNSNKKSIEYWDSVRPVPLLDKEKTDYLKKDSLEKIKTAPKYLDSLDQVNNKFKPFKSLLRGYTYSKRQDKLKIRFDPFLYLLPTNFNPAEGRVVQYKFNYSKGFEKQSNLNITPLVRYGLQRQKLNYAVNSFYALPTKLNSKIGVDFGNNIFQFNNNNPIPEFANTLTSYIWGQNWMKTYEAKFVNVHFAKEMKQGIKMDFAINYQNRSPLDNLIDSIRDIAFTPNYPTDLMDKNLTPHQALLLKVNVQWTPDSKYLELPNRIINLGSKYPTFNINLITGLKNIMGSDVDFVKWNISAEKNINLKLYGRVSTKIILGGFMNSNKVFEPDFQHYNTSQIPLSNSYLNSFQLLPYYQYSNTARFYTESHTEYHLNGFLSNKIPFFKRLNCFFVVGLNTLNVNNQISYYETLFSVENIFKIGRLDFINGYLANGPNSHGIKFSLKLFGN